MQVQAGDDDDQGPGDNNLVKDNNMRIHLQHSS